MRRKRVPPFLLPLLFILVVVLLLVGLGSWIFGGGRDAQDVVEDFYSFEAEGDFSESWELLHPFMQERFPKTSYIQDRTHVFIGHFGAETFTYTIGEEEEVEGWKMEEGREPFGTAYKYLVTQNYQGKYGKFNFQQEVYVIKHKDEWKIVWDYNQ